MGKTGFARKKTPLPRGYGRGGVGAFSGRERLLDELEELVGDVGGVFDLLEFIRGDAADGGEELAVSACHCWTVLMPLEVSKRASCPLMSHAGWDSRSSRASSLE